MEAPPGALYTEQIGATQENMLALDILEFIGQFPGIQKVSAAMF